MKKTRILSIFLSVCMILTCMAGLCVTASAAVVYQPSDLNQGSELSIDDGINGYLVKEADFDTTLVQVNGTLITVKTADKTLAEKVQGWTADKDYTITSIVQTQLGGVDLPADYQGYDSYNVYLYTFTVEEKDSPGTDVTITYVPGQGTGDPVIDAVQDGSVTLPGFRAGWTFPEGVNVQFIGWSINGTLYYIGDTVQVDTSVTAVAQYEDIYGYEEEDDDNLERPKWAEKPEYKPSGASGTAAPEEKPAEEPKDNDKQEEPKDNDKQDVPQDDPQDEPQDKDNDTTEIPEDKDTGNEGTSILVDDSKDANENPHTGAALGGLAVLALAGAAMIVSKKRK